MAREGVRRRQESQVCSFCLERRAMKEMKNNQKTNDSVGGAGGREWNWQMQQRDLCLLGARARARIYRG